MAIGQRIRFFRNKAGMTQKQLGEQLGFLGKTSDVRMAQYESEVRIPKNDLVKEMSGIFDISPRALNVPDIDSYLGLIHTLFALEDVYGIKMSSSENDISLHLDASVTPPASTLDNMFQEWHQYAVLLEQGKITKEEYDNWRYSYPDKGSSKHFAKVPSEETNNLLIKECNDLLH